MINKPTKSIFSRGAILTAHLPLPYRALLQFLGLSPPWKWSWYHGFRVSDLSRKRFLGPVFLIGSVQECMMMTTPQSGEMTEHNVPKRHAMSMCRSCVCWTFKSLALAQGLRFRRHIYDELITLWKSCRKRIWKISTPGKMSCHNQFCLHIAKRKRCRHGRLENRSVRLEQCQAAPRFWPLIHQCSQLWGPRRSEGSAPALETPFRRVKSANIIHLIWYILKSTHC